MDLGTSGHEQQPQQLVSNSSVDQYHQHQQQQSSATVTPLSPLRPVAASMLQAASNYYSTPAPLLQHHHESLTKMAKLATSGNGLGAPPKSGNDHKTSDQVVTDQAREILRQAVVTAVTESNKAAAAVASNINNNNINNNNNNNVAAGNNVNNAKTKAVLGAVRYRECQKNHAASIGGHAIDGCHEFMPSGDGDEGGDMRCAACDCHRNFHRREVEGEFQCGDCNKRQAGKLQLPSKPITVPATLPVTTLALTGAGQMTPLTMAAGAMSADSDGDQDDGPGHIVTSGGMMMSSMRSPSAIKKRFRTKFTTEQKDKMLAFAEKVGWRIQKHDEGAVHEFCASVGVKRHVLKVWMHNNKHTMGKKP